MRERTMAKVLLFNITGDRKKKLQFLLMQFGITAVEAAPGDCSVPLGKLLGRSGPFPPVTLDAPFADEMLVLDGLDTQQFHGLLNGMKMLQAQVTYKAVTTEHNLAWAPARLCRELAAEHAAITNR